MRLPFTGLLCDMDGTLVDSSASIERAWRGWAEHRGADVERVLALMPGRPAQGVIFEVLPGFDPGQADRDAAAMLARQVEDTEGVIALPGAADLLAVLPSTAWALVTSADVALARARLRAAGLPEPGVMATVDDGVPGKPAPDPFLLGARRLGVAPGASVVLEDAVAGVLGGVAAGAVVVATGSTAPPEALRAAGAVAHVPTLAHLALDGPGMLTIRQFT